MSDPTGLLIVSVLSAWVLVLFWRQVLFVIVVLGLTIILEGLLALVSALE